MHIYIYMYIYIYRYIYNCVCVYKDNVCAFVIYITIPTYKYSIIIVNKYNHFTNPIKYLKLFYVCIPHI